jgi:putative holliday junction resolvase
MRVLALDHGSKRIGLAISDEMGIIAQPLQYLPAEPLEIFLAKLKEIIDARGVGEVLVGMPRNMNGTYGPAAEKARAFVVELEKVLTIPVRTWDERLTSAQANRALIETGARREQRRERVDQTAAAILLQSYLDSRQP